MLAAVEWRAEEKRKRQLVVLAIIGVAVVLLAGIASFVPVNASFSGDSSYNCGTPFRRWRSLGALRREWRRDTAKIEKAFPATKVSGKTPVGVCPTRVRTRFFIVGLAGAVGVTLVTGSVGIYWYRFGLIRDPHV
jgi:hypothetical protein